MPRGYLRKNNFTKDTILRIAMIGVITIAAGTSPFLLQRLVREYFKDKNQKVAKARAKKLRELERRKLVNFKELGGGSVRIELTHHGKTLVRTYNLEEMELKIPKRWDGEWRIIIYDIPTHQKKASNAFREKIKKLGLYALQRSVWVSPYECLPEIEFLATVFDINIDNCICYFHVKNIPHKKEVKKFFNL